MAIQGEGPQDRYFLCISGEESQIFSKPHDREPPQTNSGNQIIFTKSPPKKRTFLRFTLGDFKVYFGGTKVYFGVKRLLLKIFLKFWNFDIFLSDSRVF